MSGSLADRSISFSVRDRVRFGVGAIAGLPELVRDAGGHHAYIVTDPGVVASGVVETVLDILASAGLGIGLFAEVEPNPGDALVERAAADLRASGTDGTVIVPIGGGSAIDTAKAISLLAMNDAPLWDLGYDDPALVPGRPLVAVPTTAGTGAEAHSFGVIIDEMAGRKGFVGHPSLLPVATILDPALTVGLPPAVTASTGIDAFTHALESLLSANPNPFAEAMAVHIIRTVGEWLPRAFADGADLEARSQMLLASHLAGVGQASGTGVGLVHALGHALGTRGRLPHGTALAVVLPEVLRFYAASSGLRDRELALVGIALRAASPTEPPASAAAAAIGAIGLLCTDLGQRTPLRALGFDEALLDVVATDALLDPTIRNSPRLPTLAETRAILASVSG
jgi:alcohol dehydrogenase